MDSHYVHFRFLTDGYENLLPLSFDKKLLLCSKDWDFMLDGYSIFNLRDVEKVTLKTDLYSKIMVEEGITTTRPVPDIDLSCWRTAFEGLSKLGGYVMVEKRAVKNNDWVFVIGHIEKIGKKNVCLQHFDADGEWVDAPCKIPYGDILCVDFSRRYINYYTKYVQPPQRFKSQGTDA